MKSLINYILESSIKYIDLAKEWWESSDNDQYSKNNDNKNKEAQELSLTDGEYQCLLDWCDWLENKKNIKTYSLWDDGPKADKNAPEDWSEATTWLIERVYSHKDE